MTWLYVTLGVIFGLILLCLITSLVCFFIVFYSPKRKTLGPDEYEIPPGKIYEPYRDYMISWAKKARAMPHEDITITSYDGLTLFGRYVEQTKGAPIEILFHGYRGYVERDLSGAIDRCFSIGRNALIVDQRASGKSEGNVITFGAKEKYDCVAWANYVAQRFGPEQEIILCGVSMGGATVTMASSMELPENVVCTLADCPYSTASGIIKKIIKDLKLPVWLLFPFVQLGALLFGGFKLEDASPLEAVKNCKVPIIFIHGDNDDFIPHQMSDELYEACPTLKKIVKIEGAGHGLAFPTNKEKYYGALLDFEKQWRAYKEQKNAT